jgi:hypothetical protein
MGLATLEKDIKLIVEHHACNFPPKPDGQERMHDERLSGPCGLGSLLQFSKGYKVAHPTRRVIGAHANERGTDLRLVEITTRESIRRASPPPPDPFLMNVMGLASKQSQRQRSYDRVHVDAR